MVKAICVLLFMLSFAGCAPSIKRMGYNLNPDSLRTVTEVNFTREARDFSDFKKIGTMSIYDNGFSINCSEEKILVLLENEAKRIGATKVNLYNIQEPSFFGSTCFQTYADFYAPSSTATDSDPNSETTQTSKPATSDADLDKYAYETIEHSGLEFRIGIAIGSVLSGGQKDLALGGLTPTPDGVQCVGYPLSVTKWWDWIGISGGYGFALASATKQNYKPLALYNQHILRAGATLAPIRRQTARNLHRMLIGGGLNYSMLTFNADNVIQMPGTARGFGYYLSGGYSWMYNGGLSFGLDFSYESRSPKMDGALLALSANEFQVLMRLGYFWHWTKQ